MANSLPDRETVFVVDDSPTMCELVRLQLLDMGCEPVVFDSAEKCLEALARRRPMFIVMDLNLSPMRGDACCQKIKENPAYRDLPVIIMTGADDPHEVMNCWRAAADDFLPKPLKRSHLEAKLRSLRATAAKAPEGPAASVSKKILLVEDSRFYRNVLGGTLEHAGMHVLYAKDGQEALLLALQHASSIDASLIDLVLPKLHGIEVARALRNNPALASKPMLMMSGIEEITPALEQQIRELTGGAVLDKRVLPIEAILAKVHATLRPQLMELRAAERVPFFSVVEFRSQNGDWQSGFSYDVSTGGIFVRTLSACDIGAEVQLKLAFAGQMNDNTSLGVVAWANRFRSRNSFSAPIGMGIRFTRLDAQLARQLAKVVSVSAQSAPPD